MFGDEWMLATELPAFGKRLRNARVATGKSQWDLAHELGVSAQTILNWEKAHSQPNPSKLPKIAASVGTPVQFLRTGREESEPETLNDNPSRSISADIQHLEHSVALALGLQPGEVVLSFQLRRERSDLDGSPATTL